MANRTKRLPSTRRSAPFSRFFRFGNFNNIKERSTVITTRGVKFVERKPFTSFFIALGVLFLLILLGSTIFRTRTTQEQTKVTPKNVTVYSLGEAPRISVQGEVKKSGVIQIVAQAPGIVSAINVTEGQETHKGKPLINLASNYQGGNAFTVQRQLAGATYQNTKETYDLQINLLQRQRDLANRQSENAEEIRRLTRTSIDETRTLVNLNGEILRGIQAAIQNPSTNAEDLPGLIAQQAQLQAGQNQLQAGLRLSEYQVDESRPAVDLERIGRDIALNQLDLQEKALKFSLQAASLQLKLAQIQESTMFPTAPFKGTVQRVHVRIGESVNPGTPLITIAGHGGEIVIDAKVPQDIATKISTVNVATITVGERQIKLAPFYVSDEATAGQLYSVLFSVDEMYRSLFTDSSFVSISLPVGHIATEQVTPFIPVDSVFQTQNEAFVFVVQNGRAHSKKVKLGPVTGSYVTVEQGLTSRDQIILNRTVVDGDPIRITN